MQVSLIVAMSENRVIGKLGKLPWHLPNDLIHFKKLTTGKNILMGRKTFDSIGRALPNRNNLVLTKNLDLRADAITVFHSKEELLDSKLDELMVIGGEEIYKLFLPECRKIYLTLVHDVVAGDAFFPDFHGFYENNRETYESDRLHAYRYSFIEYLKNER